VYNTAAFMGSSIHKINNEELNSSINDRDADSDNDEDVDKNNREIDQKVNLNGRNVRLDQVYK
jgi:hypothetical protein